MINRRKGPQAVQDRIKEINVCKRDFPFYRAVKSDPIFFHRPGALYPLPVRTQ